MREYSSNAEVIFTALPPIPDDLSRAHDFLEELDTLSGTGVLIVNL